MTEYETCNCHKSEMAAINNKLRSAVLPCHGGNGRVATLSPHAILIEHPNDVDFYASTKTDSLTKKGASLNPL
jgi:hypothetical protein